MTDFPPLPEPVAWMYSSSRGVDLVRNRWDELLRSMGPADMTEDALVPADQLHAYTAALQSRLSAAEAECARLRAFINGRFRLRQFSDTGRWAALTELGYLATGECFDADAAITAALDNAREGKE